MRLITYVWLHLVLILTGWLPDVTPVLRLRGLLARPAFRKCGRNLQLARHVHIGFPNRLELGRDVFIGYGAWIQAAGSIVIGDEVLIAPYAVLVSGDHTMKNGSYRYGDACRAPIHIGKGSWIGAHATLTSGVSIGEGAMLAANAVATEDVPAFCIAGGVPARVLKQGISNGNPA